MKKFSIAILSFLTVLTSIAYARAESGEPIGRISELYGKASVIRGGSQTEELSYKSRIYQNDRITTGADGRVKILFSDDSVMAIGANTDITITEFIYKPAEKEQKSSFSLLKGKALAFVGRLFRTAQAKYEIKTPTAVAGVRGTSFSVTVIPLEEEEGSPDAPDAGGAGSGGDGEDAREFETIIRVHEGTVTVRALAAQATAAIDLSSGQEIYVRRDGVGEAREMSEETIKKDLSMSSIEKLKPEKSAKDGYRLTAPGRERLRRHLPAAGERGGKERRVGSDEAKERRGRHSSEGGELLRDAAGEGGDDERRGIREQIDEGRYTQDDTTRRARDRGEVNVDVRVLPPGSKRD
ncbi:MAG: hypothetical protein Kow0090_15990 [Myxococcota bacterium]